MLYVKRTLREMLPGALCAVCLLACTPRFENPTTIADLRMLGVKTEPPEVLIDLGVLAATGALPEPLPSIQIEPLVLDPKGAGRPVSMRIEVCPNQPDVGLSNNQMRGGRVGDTVSDSPCPEGSMLVAEQTSVAGPDGVVPFTATFNPTLPFLIEAARADPLGIELGLPIGLTLTVRAGDEKIVGYKRVIFSPRLTPEQKPNQNPVVQVFVWRISREQQRRAIDPLAPPRVGAGNRIRVGVLPAEAEAYPARSFSAAQRRFYTEQVPEETLRYNFYATQGVFGPGTVNNDPSPLRTNPIVELETVYEAPETPTPGEIDIYVVVRDERAGASFTRSKLRLD